MANYVFYDFETDSSNKFFGQIIEIGAILVNDDLEELDRFESRCRLSPGTIPEAMALLVNKTTPKMLKETNLSHYEMIRQFIKKLKDWGKALSNSKLLNPMYTAFPQSFSFFTNCLIIS